MHWKAREMTYETRVLTGSFYQCQVYRVDSPATHLLAPFTRLILNKLVVHAQYSRLEKPGSIPYLLCMREKENTFLF